MAVKIGKDLEFDIQAGRVIKKTMSPVTSQGSPLAIIYCRVSTDGQVTEGNGLESQRDACNAWCERNNNVQVVRTFMDKGISGTDLKRQGIGEAIAFLKKENAKYIKIKYFVCTETSRISRSENLLASLGLESEIKATGAEIVYVFSPISSESDDADLITNLNYVIAANERKKIAKRCRNGSRSALLQGKRPFSTVPLGYVRVKNGKEKSTIIDPIKAPILKEGLELFADDILYSQGELLDYFNKKGLQTNGKGWKGKLRLTFLEKLFLIYRLMFMAGYIIYPRRDINELIQGQHQGIISLETANKILQKINKKSIGRRSYPVPSGDAFILRGMVRCPVCNRKLTTWYSRSHTGKQHAYYGCASKCPGRCAIPKDKMEEEFIQLLKSIQISKPMSEYFDACLEKRFLHKQNALVGEKHEKQNRIRAIENKMKLVEEGLLTLSTPALIRKYESDWSSLNQEKEQLQAEMDDSLLPDHDLFEITKKTKDLFTSPLAFWAPGDLETRQLLTRVWFGTGLTFSRQDGYHTSQKSLINTVLGGSSTMIGNHLG